MSNFIPDLNDALRKLHDDGNKRKLLKNFYVFLSNQLISVRDASDVRHTYITTIGPVMGLVNTCDLMGILFRSKMECSFLASLHHCRLKPFMRYGGDTLVIGTRCQVGAAAFITLLK